MSQLSPSIRMPDIEAQLRSSGLFARSLLIGPYGISDGCRPFATRAILPAQTGTTAFSGGLVGSIVLGQIFDAYGWHATVTAIAISAPSRRCPARA